jgi:Ca2+-binding RTX toxin-like protein
MPRFLALAVLCCLLGVVPIALAANSHEYWPKITGKLQKAKGGSVTYTGTRKADELLGYHGSDKLYGKDGSDVLWGDWAPSGQPTSQNDYIAGGNGRDFIYASHGRNVIDGGAGNDAISAHYGHGTIDCGPGKDIYHVPKSLIKKYKVKNCEKVDRRSEKQRGGHGLKPFPEG